MNKYILLFSLIFVSCGGGGGDGSGAFFGGVYSGVAELVSDNCNLGSDPAVLFNWTVNQDPSRVVLETDSGATYEGAATSNNSFAVTKSESSSDRCHTVTSIYMSEIKAASANVIFGYDITCGVLTCTVSYVGEAVRN